MGNEKTALINSYYDAWKYGLASFDKERLRGLLSSDIKFDGPPTGRTYGIDAFVAGLERFA
jgi:hypothetical protein